MNESTARIRINDLLKNAGWRFFPDDENHNPANILLEHHTKATESQLHALGDDFENTKHKFIDYLLLDSNQRPVAVLEAKASDKHPLDGKEQARTYARAQNCRFIILSNGNLHYFWDIDHGDPAIIQKLPTPEAIGERKQKGVPNPQFLVDEHVGDDYIVRTQFHNYERQAAWRNQNERPDFIRTNKLRFLRRYQINAIHALQRAVEQGKDRFLFEMATGTGKTLTAAAIIKLFLKTGNASRVLFLVDRLELEDQAFKAFNELIQTDFTTAIYKQKRTDWRNADIVVTTVQSLLFNNKYQELFSPTDFDFVISDEAHRSINGNARAVFDYFMGYKLGLTATPRDYLRGTQQSDDENRIRDPREIERRQLRDTYLTFGCETEQPTFRYSLIDGVKDGFLINPRVVDARSDITTQMLSDDGFIATFKDIETDEDEDEDKEMLFRKRDFEKSFFSVPTNQTFCRTFLEHALRDPLTKEVGKSIIFTVSQNHAANITQILNELASKMFPGKYQSDFAVQVTSSVQDAQLFATQFANNNLSGSGNLTGDYLTSKTRVCVTVGMMTTGYDCPDILNLALMRPIFSPTDFVQIKGRGTRKHDFRDQAVEEYLKESLNEGQAEKSSFKLFDFFANCEYFENEFDYDQILELPKIKDGKSSGGDGGDKGDGPVYMDGFNFVGQDQIATIQEQHIGYEGMKIDRMLFNRFADTVKADETVVNAVENEAWDIAIDHIIQEIFDKPEEYFNLDKLRQSIDVDRRISLREIVQRIFGHIPKFKSRDEVLDEEFDKFIAIEANSPTVTGSRDFAYSSSSSDIDTTVDAAAIPAIKSLFKAYATNNQIREIIDTDNFIKLSSMPVLSIADLRTIPESYRAKIPNYIKDNISLNQF